MSNPSSSSQLTNLCLRFDWILYIYFDRDNVEVCAFIAAMLEMLRRVQWNFCTNIFSFPRDRDLRCSPVSDRVENKHLSNKELYRITREPALPYFFDGNPNEEEEHVVQLQLRKRMARLS